MGGGRLARIEGVIAAIVEARGCISERGEM